MGWILVLAGFAVTHSAGILDYFAGAAVFAGFLFASFLVWIAVFALTAFLIGRARQRQQKSGR